MPKEIIEESIDGVIMRDLQPRYNIAPGPDEAVIRVDPEGTRHLDLLRWGTNPSWDKDLRDEQPILASHKKRLMA